MQRDRETMNELKASQKKLKQMMILNTNKSSENDLKQICNYSGSTKKKETSFFHKFNSSSIHNNEFENDDDEEEDDEEEEDEEEEEEEEDQYDANGNQGGGLSFDCSGDIDEENKFQLAGIKLKFIYTLNS